MSQASIERTSKYTCLAAIAVLAGACTVNVNTASILSSDDAVKPLDMSALEGLVPETKLEAISIRHSDGVTTHGIHLAVPGSKATIIYLSGNKMRINERGAPLLPMSHALGPTSCGWTTAASVPAKASPPLKICSPTLRR